MSKVKKKVLKVVKIVLIILMVIALINLLLWYKEKKKVLKIVSNIDDFLVINNDSYRIEDDIVQENDETIGWIIVENTNINYPIVQSKDNSFYLNHDYYKNENDAGWIFMDSNNKLDDQNLVIYGHHRRDGIMFGDVDKLMKKNYYEDNKGEILLIIGDQNIYYKIFAVYKAKVEENYYKNNFDDFPHTLGEFQKKSKIKFDENLEGVSQIITLSTCHSNNKDRLVIQAYKKLT